MKSNLTRGVMLAAASVLAVTLSACGSDDADDTASDAGSGSTADSSADSSSPATEAASDEPFGEGCAAVPADGEGSFEGMTDDPVAAAASNNPALSVLAETVRAANLVDTLNGLEEVTVIAPANVAFEAIPQDALAGLTANTPVLVAVLTHHVIEGRLTPDELAGTHTTLNGDQVTIAGSGEQFTIGQTLTGTPASVICGNVQTANATVYIVDQVLARSSS